ncbi:MAG TPA: tryptophan synthase subunit beta, partial [Methanobacterium sp.]|nr:tryptophan synthase subunit beta [Methanobacterium sp.]
AHAIAYAKKYAEKKENKGKIIIINLSGRGDKDMDLVSRQIGG